MGTSATDLSGAGSSGEEAAGAVLAFEGVSKVFPDGTHALEDVSFSVSRGEFVTLVGPSGCGKSTLLRIASDLDAATGGTVQVDRDRIGYIFQDATLMPWRTVLGNVELLGELHGHSREERRRLARAAISTVGLEGFEGHYPKALSGGMRMRASIARTLTLNPPLFLFDEPFGALDEITRERLNEETISLFMREQFAALFITHSIYEAVYLSTRVLVMSPRPGRITASFDIPFEYPRAPQLRYEAAFAELTGAVSAALRGSFDHD
ncbi:MAG: ABC transporter ATP-binding protein [bacterium]|nr:ABC transporter ATP-binding protein [bacterium]MXZ29753.1 ABC transporter ATP-binding protein [Acidimicrobiia bacterium]MDE0669418.1 ABC transporter ATP-binding protein [bacterium]MYB25478.1 ABC transporter ATP-binding protein [Acidimicrobiia bacterium]MYE67712.1 ABC transporter ATP-binding protein [Acidimicrobiia bacterium]